jgi:hypothetical protein
VPVVKNADECIALAVRHPHEGILAPAIEKASVRNIGRIASRLRHWPETIARG